VPQRREQRLLKGLLAAIRTQPRNTEPQDRRTVALQDGLERLHNGDGPPGHRHGRDETSFKAMFTSPE
jgi:hypothetical protein